MCLQRGLTTWSVKKVMGKEPLPNPWSSIYEIFIMIACDQLNESDLTSLYPHIDDIKKSSGFTCNS